MKRLIVPFLLLFLLPLSYSCTSGRFAGYKLNENDAAAAIRQMLQLGVQESNFTGAFNKETIMTAVLPEGVRKAMNTVSMLGLTNEIDRFTTTLGTAAEKTATNSIPIFASGISNMQFTDAMHIIKAGGTAGTDYLRASIGDSLRRSIRPVVETALQEYKLNDMWNEIVKPLGGNKIKLDLPTIMAGAVSEAMFRKVAEKERLIRAEKEARTTTLLQKVFSKSWS
ncbi:DUF4197 domain-containing protein [Flavisolibacter tropicus]|uniref:DUF4197 domain-containing protein n=1 Tax=Flavisolibacter tropicus TaxID=1492898 RepID=A0A172TWY3_9BACT|nr:DUF4197 domain-containing protein [Flavisolibacter tropicus]ANE51247.1 hypothetical protein SY85_12745 [Flavisolibacter tropicus]